LGLSIRGEMMNKFFWGGNTGRGSVNFAKDFFLDAKRRILIKGGPGTGKSSFLKRIVEQIKSPVIFYCPSSPNSLDTIADFDRGFFVTDATAPHAIDPQSPGVRDEILDFGRYWNSSLLKSNSEKIREASKRTSLHFTLAYAALGKALKMREQLENILGEKSPGIVDEKHYLKVWDEINSLNLERNKEGLGNKFNRFVSAYTPLGFRKLEVDADKTYLFLGSPSLTKTYLDPLAGVFLGYGYDVLFFIDPLDGLNYEGLYVPKLKLHIQVSWPDLKKHNDLEREIEERIKAEEDFGIAELTKAFMAHEDLEKLYIEAMDFDLMEKELEGFLKGLFVD